MKKHYRILIVSDKTEAYVLRKRNGLWSLIIEGKRCKHEFLFKDLNAIGDFLAGGLQFVTDVLNNFKDSPSYSKRTPK